MQLTTQVQAERFASTLIEELQQRFSSYGDIVTCLRGMLTDRRIIEILNQALTETAVRNYVNKHGVEHGYKVALNMLKLFHLIESDCIQSDYITDFPDFELQRKHLLWALLVGSFIHDAGRFYDASIDHESQVSEAMKIVEEYIPGLGDLKQKEKDFIPRVIKELCLCHDKKAEMSGKVEIALIKLADAFDCERDRTYQKNRWQDERGQIDESRKIKDIFRNDRLPENYFGTYAVESVDLEWNEYENAVDAKLVIADWAASLPIRSVHQVLKFCESGTQSVANLSKRIRLMVCPPGQQAILLHPESLVVTPDLKANSAEYKLDIDDKGNGEVQMTMVAENIARSKRRAIRFEFWGLKETTWDRDVQVKMWDHEDRSLRIEYKGKGELPVSHSWLAILNEDLSPGQRVRIIGKYRWKNLVHLNKDEFVYQLQLPTDHLRIKVIFPKGFPSDLEKLHWDVKFMEMTDAGRRVALSSPMLAHIEMIHDRLSLCSDCYNLSSGHIYCVEWRTSTYNSPP